MDFNSSTNRAEWLEWRRQGIGSSDATTVAVGAGLVSAPKWMQPEGLQRLYWDKIGLGGPEKSTTSAMQRGIDLEETARAAAESHLGFIAPVNVECKTHPFIRASLDGLTLEDEIVEIKVPNDAVVEAASNGLVVDYYQAQLAHQLSAVHGHPSTWSGKEGWHFVALCARTEVLHIVSGKSEQLRPLALKLFAQCERLWDHVQRRVPIVGGERWLEVSSEIIAAKSAQAQADAIKKRIADAVRNDEYFPRNLRVARTKAQMRKMTDYKAALRDAGYDLDKLAEEYAPEGTYTWSNRGGAIVDQERIDAMAPSDAEDAYLAFDHGAIEEHVKKALMQGYDLAQELGVESLVGPSGLTIFQRKTPMEWSAVAKKYGVKAGPEHIKEYETAAGIALSISKEWVKAI